MTNWKTMQYYGARQVKVLVEGEKNVIKLEYHSPDSKFLMMFLHEHLS
jgi:hypothetical protein